MNAEIGFEWPKALRATRRAAEEGTLASRALFPVEIKALCDLVAGAPLDGSPRELAPGMAVTAKDELKTEKTMEYQRRAYYFIARFSNGRIWQCSLFTQWQWVGAGSYIDSALYLLKPQNIVQAVTRSIAPETARAS